VLDVGWRQRPDHEPVGRTVTQQPLHRNRPFAGGDRERHAPRHRKRGLRNVEFIVRDLTGFDATAKQGNTISSQRSTPCTTRRGAGRPEGIHRALKDDGWYLMQDIRG